MRRSLCFFSFLLLLLSAASEAASQRLIHTGERSGLQTHIATTENASLYIRINC